MSEIINELQNQKYFVSMLINKDKLKGQINRGVVTPSGQGGHCKRNQHTKQYPIYMYVQNIQGQCKI